MAPHSHSDGPQQQRSLVEGDADNAALASLVRLLARQAARNWLKVTAAEDDSAPSPGERR
jgi:hypothetical protein